MMWVKNLREAVDEMWDFITDLPSSTDGFESDFDEAFGELEEIESEDVVKVVRCRDCEHWDGTWCVINEAYFEADDFCSYGERKEKRG